MRNKKIIIASFFIISFTFGGVMHPLFGSAQSINDLRSQSAKLQKEIDANHKQAEHLEHEGNTLKSAISSLDSQIHQATKEIDLTDRKIALLGKQLKAAKIELARQKELLKANMLALYKRGDASTVEMIVGSDNFSQYIDEQEYLERLKSSIQESTEKIVTLTQEIESQKKEQEELQKKQESARKSLNDSRSQRASLLEQTEGKEAEYRQMVAGLQAKRVAVEKALTARLLSGSYVNLGSVNEGQMVGRVGMTGMTFGPHLHFELRNSSLRPINPMGAGTWPVSGYKSISQAFGCSSIAYVNTMPGCPSSEPYLHTGIDIPAPIGTPIVAAKSGIIIHRSNDGDGYGNKVVIKHSDGTYTYYAHMQ